MFYNRPAGVKFYDRGDIDVNDFTLAMLLVDGSWHNMDLQHIVGKRRVQVLLHVNLRVNADTKKIQFRTYGNTNEVNIARCFTQTANKIYDAGLLVCTDADGFIEYYADSYTWEFININVRGWYV